MTRVPTHRLSPATNTTSTSDDPEDWRDHAACLTEDPELFYAPDGERQPDRDYREALAKAVCRRCPVQAACLQDALGREERDGVWGGLTQRQLQAMHRAQRRTRGKARTATQAS